MNVPIASQVLSDNVADALLYLKDENPLLKDMKQQLNFAKMSIMHLIY